VQKAFNYDRLHILLNIKVHIIALVCLVCDKWSTSYAANG